MKICSKCKIEKDESEFNKEKTRKDGLGIYCRICARERNAKYRNENPEKEKKKSANYYLENKEIISEKTAIRRAENPEKYHIKNRKWKKENQEKVKESSANYYLENKEIISEKSAIKYAENPDYYKEKSEIWRKSHLDVVRDQKRQRRLEDGLFKLRSNIRCLITNSIKNNGFSKNGKTFEILGCSFEEFIAYIEDKFQEGMSWDNRNLWHLDHIYPVSLAESEDKNYLMSLMRYKFENS